MEVSGNINSGRPNPILCHRNICFQNVRISSVSISIRKIISNAAMDHTLRYERNGFDRGFHVAG